jgi:hypothetical protein
VIVTDPAAPLDVEAFERRTGWAIKPVGACKGDVCVPLPGTDATTVAQRLGMPLVADEEHGLWALGPETGFTGRALTTVALPDIALPDLSGELFELRSLRGQKVLLVAWASW